MAKRFGFLATLGASATTALGANIPMFNSSFELPVMAPGGFTIAVPPGWVSLSPAVTMGVWNPQTWNAYTPDKYVGAQIGYINEGKLEKRMPSVIKGNSTWALRWKVGRRPGFNGGLTIKFYAGDILMGQQMDTLASLPPDGTFAERSIEFSVPADSPAIGLPVLFTLEKTIGSQANFDDFRLESSDPGPACPADLNEDQAVTDEDFSLFANRYDLVFAEPDGKGDLNFDAFVDDQDFQLFIVQYNILECPQ
ncbi:MAG: hypothetical protein K2Y21_09295 [Phycisphaerales bacterium]|nr:hypothetical protein [Phycisphaerales bacterium]